jgi:hypothetical protein
MELYPSGLLGFIDDPDRQFGNGSVWTRIRTRSDGPEPLLTLATPDNQHPPSMNTASTQRQHSINTALTQRQQSVNRVLTILAVVTCVIHGLLYGINL